MDLFKLHPAHPDMQALIRNEQAGIPYELGELGEGLKVEIQTDEHKAILERFKADHGRGISQLGDVVGLKRISVEIFGPLILCGNLKMPQDSICTFIPLEYVTPSDQMARVSYKIGETFVPITVWQVESPFRLPPGAVLRVELEGVRFLMERHVFTPESTQAPGN